MQRHGVVAYGVVELAQGRLAEIVGVRDFGSQVEEPGTCGHVLVHHLSYHRKAGIKRKVRLLGMAHEAVAALKYGLHLFVGRAFRHRLTEAEAAHGHNCGKRQEQCKGNGKNTFHKY